MTASPARSADPAPLGPRDVAPVAVRDAATPMLAQLAAPGVARCVSIIVPCRNERAYIDAFCDAALAQRLPLGDCRTLGVESENGPQRGQFLSDSPPHSGAMGQESGKKWAAAAHSQPTTPKSDSLLNWQLELLVADGQSDDGTRARLEARAAQDARLRVIDNPQRIVSTGLNACLAQARGAVIVRMDVHTRFAPDYVAECLAALARSGADNVGGPWVARGQGAWGRAIAAAFQCRWVVGGARSRDRGYEGEVDTVYLGCWPRAVLARVGGFDETLVRNQDDEHNLRLRRQGGRIWQSARIHSWYVPRDALGALFRQQFQYGYWRPFVLRKHGQPGSVRQLVPMIFVAALAVSMTVLPIFYAPLAGLLLAYAAYLGGASLAAARGAVQDAAAPRGARWGLLWRLPAVIAAYHLGYGLGGWRGMIDILWRRHAGPAMRDLTR